MSVTADELLEGTNPSPLHVLAPVGALLLVVAFAWSGADSRTVWYVIRSTGIVAYVLLAASVIGGLLISGRVGPGERRADLYEIHTFTSLLALAFGMTHGLSLLLDNFVRFSPVQILVPFTSDYRPVSVSLGIIGMYLTAAVYGSFWIRHRIGYRRWRVFHYATFAAFILLTTHALLSGSDARSLWMIVIVAASCAAVAALTLNRVLSRAAPRRASAGG